MEENLLSEEEIVDEVKKLLNKIRPYLNSEGGDLEYLDFKDGVVYVRMLGACQDCGSLDSTLKDGIQELLVENIPGVVEVVNITDEM